MKKQAALDVIIIGAGAAGLQAAHELKIAKKSFLILEARDRIGGRAYTQATGNHPLSVVELSGEFIHGEAAFTKKLLREQGTSFYDLAFDYHEFKNGKLKPVKDYWETLTQVFQKIKKRKVDQSFAAFLQAHPHLPALQRKMASAFVEGFDAAELDQISANSMSEMKAQVDDEAERALAKPMFGYHSLLQFIAKNFKDEIRLEHDVETIKWQKNSVRVSGHHRNHTFQFSAKKLIVTVPVGALHRLSWSPRPVELDYFKTLRMGQVAKLTFEMKPEFLDYFPKAQFPFVVSPGLHFKTWWSMAPLRLPLIVAWAGGKHAIELSRLTAAKRQSLAVQDLAQLAKVTRAQLQKHLIKIHEHNWAQDVYAQGAYSYPAVEDPNQKHRSLRPIKDTIYFAGEAYESEHQGTVEGALLSGLKSAQLTLKGAAKRVKRGKNA